MTQKFNQLLAVERSLKTRAEAAFTENFRLLEKAPQLFQGSIRTYQPKDDDGAKLPNESQVVQARVEEVFQKVKDFLSEFFDLTGAKDNTNTVAFADVEVDGQTVLKGAPATHLLWLEKKLDDLLQFIAKAPTLDPSYVWNPDQQEKVWRTEPIRTMKTAKVVKPLVLAQATKEHPAQVTKETFDEIAGYWDSTHLSAALPPARKEQLIRRVQKVQYAVKRAREQANTVEIKPLKSSQILDYIFAPTSQSQ